MTYTPVTADEFAALSEDDPTLRPWRYIVGSLVGEFKAADFPAAGAFAAAVAVAAEKAQHHPDVVVRYPGLVTITLSTHDVGGVSNSDVELASTITRLAELADAVEPSAIEVAALQIVEFAIDTAHADAIRPFWAAVLGYVERDGALVDPARRGAPMWFQTTDDPPTGRADGRNRIHLDISVPHDVAEARVAAAVAAGGRVVTDQYARSWWVLADADGNEACICTWQDR